MTATTRASTSPRRASSRQRSNPRTVYTDAVLLESSSGSTTTTKQRSPVSRRKKQVLALDSSGSSSDDDDNDNDEQQSQGRRRSTNARDGRTKPSSRGGRRSSSSSSSRGRSLKKEIKKLDSSSSSSDDDETEPQSRGGRRGRSRSKSRAAASRKKEEEETTESLASKARAKFRQEKSSKKKTRKKSKKASDDDDEPNLNKMLLSDDEEGEEPAKIDGDDEEISEPDDNDDDDDSDDKPGRTRRFAQQYHAARRHSSSKPTTTTTPKKRKQSSLKLCSIKKTPGSARRGSVCCCPTRRILFEHHDSANLRSAKTALAAIAKKVLEEGENPENSLTAALLQCLQQQDGMSKGGSSSSIYSTPLAQICARIVNNHMEDWNDAQLELVRLLFRSIGATRDATLTELDPTVVEIESIHDDEWAQILANLIDSMQFSGTDEVLLFADPKEHTAKGKAAATGVEEYRKIYQDFWYTLGWTVLNTTNIAIHNDDDTSSSSASPEYATMRAQTALCNQIMHRLLEVSDVGHADLRFAASLAAYQFALALLEHTNELTVKRNIARRQWNSATCGSNNPDSFPTKPSSKVAALKDKIDLWNTTINTVDGLVTGPLFQGIFLKRYRDARAQTRASSLLGMTRFALCRPDLFLSGTYYKYLGWMLNDKDAIVRRQALAGLNAPFERVQDDDSNSSLSLTSDHLDALSPLVEKFLQRIADCTVDVDDECQKQAMALLLRLLRMGFLDSLSETSPVWEMCNKRALARLSNPTVRRDALYFVCDQVEAFDSDAQAVSDTVIIQRIQNLAGWLAYTIEKFEYDIDRVDYVVQSLLSMEEHRPLVTSWPLLLRALNEPSTAAAATDDGCDDDDAAMAAATKSPSAAALSAKKDPKTLLCQQRVVLHMLVCAAELCTFEHAAALTMMDHGYVGARQERAALASQQQPPAATTNTLESPGEVLTLALLDALPGLMDVYKTEIQVLRGLTKLPRFFQPTVFNLASRVDDFTKLLGSFSSLFLESTDPDVLTNCATVMSCLAVADHSRSAQALVKLQEVAKQVHTRLMQLYADRKALQEKHKSGLEWISMPEASQLEHAIGMTMTRLYHLYGKWNVPELLAQRDGSFEDGKGCDRVMEALCGKIGEELAADLRLRSNEAASEIWNANSSQRQLHEYCAVAVEHGLGLLLTALALRWGKEREWRQQGHLTGTPPNVQDHVLIRQRERICRLLLLCFEQFIPKDGPILDDEHPRVLFADRVQVKASTVLSDVRSLFPRKWAKDKGSAFLRAVALTNDKHCAGGSARFLGSKQDVILGAKAPPSSHPRLAETLVTAAVRGMRQNWVDMTRGEPSRLLVALSSTEGEVKRTVQDFCMQAWKEDPKRWLEVHNALLKTTFQEWIEQEPEEPEDDERPSAEALHAFEQEQNAHHEMLDALVNRAEAMSESLGLSKPSKKAVISNLWSLLDGGIRYAFSEDVKNADPDEYIGMRLPFLRLLSHYLKWIKSDKKCVAKLGDEFNRLENQLRVHPDYNEIDDLDLAAMQEFRKCGGFGQYPFEDEDIEHDEGDDTAPITASKRSSRAGTSIVLAGSGVQRKQRRMSNGSTANSSLSSLRSKPTLTPVKESTRAEESVSPASTNAAAATSPQSTLANSTFRSDKPDEEKGDDDSDDVLDAAMDTDDQASGSRSNRTKGQAQEGEHESVANEDGQSAVTKRTQESASGRSRSSGNSAGHARPEDEADGSIAISTASKSATSENASAETGVASKACSSKTGSHEGVLSSGRSPATKNDEHGSGTPLSDKGATAEGSDNETDGDIVGKRGDGPDPQSAATKGSNASSPAKSARDSDMSGSHVATNQRSGASSDDNRSNAASRSTNDAKSSLDEDASVMSGSRATAKGSNASSEDNSKDAASPTTKGSNTTKSTRDDKSTDMSRSSAKGTNASSVGKGSDAASTSTKGSNATKSTRDDKSSDMSRPSAKGTNASSDGKGSDAASPSTKGSKTTPSACEERSSVLSGSHTSAKSASDEGSSVMSGSHASTKRSSVSFSQRENSIASPAKKRRMNRMSDLNSPASAGSKSAASGSPASSSSISALSPRTPQRKQGTRPSDESDGEEASRAPSGESDGEEVSRATGGTKRSRESDLAMSGENTHDPSGSPESKRSRTSKSESGGSRIRDDDDTRSRASAGSFLDSPESRMSRRSKADSSVGSFLDDSVESKKSSTCGSFLDSSEAS